MKIEIWSDVVCPWCYIGKRRFEKALADVRARRRGRGRLALLRARPGRAAPSRRAGDRACIAPQVRPQPEAVRADAAAAIEASPPRRAWSSGSSRRVHANTVDAHRLLHLALEQGGPQLQGRAQGGAARGVLHRGPRRRRPRRAARRRRRRSGLDAAAGRRGPRPGRVRRRRARRRRAGPGATAPPVSRSSSSTRSTASPGAQPTEVFTQVLERAWAESHPKIQVLATGADGQECGPDGCADLTPARHCALIP